MLNNLGEMLQTAAELARMSRRVKQAQAEYTVAKVLCHKDLTEQTKQEAIDLMMTEGPGREYATLTRENIMERAKAVAGQSEPIQFDFEARTVSVATFENPEGVVKLVTQETSPRVANMFFEFMQSLGVTNNAQVTETIERIKNCRLHKVKGIPVKVLMRMDMAYAADGHPLCEGCGIHHPMPGSPADEDCNRTLH